MSTDIQKYCVCMEEVKQRLVIVESVGARRITTGVEQFDIELVFIQFRKSLELIAFASLIANKAEYSAAFQNFEQHWNAERILRALEKINPEFFPRAVGAPLTTAPGVKHFPAAPEGYMTKEDFVSLHDNCGKLLHSRNPFSTESPILQIGYSAKEWVIRIQKLLEWHVAQLVGGDVWVLNVPLASDVHAWPATPNTSPPVT